jgi:hypothetical protein
MNLISAHPPTKFMFMVWTVTFYDAGVQSKVKGSTEEVEEP